MRKNQFDVANRADPASQQINDGRVLLNPLFLKRLRQKRGLSQDALAQLCLDKHLALSLASIKRAEAGKAVSYRTARHLAGIFNTELDSLMLPTVNRNAGQDATNAPASDATAQLQRAPMLDRRRVLRSVSVIFFCLESNEFNAAAQKHVLESGARTITNPDGTQLAVIFGAPAHRCADALAALRCAINLQSYAATRARLILRRRAVAEVFCYATNADATPDRCAGQADSDRAIYLETDLATQLSVHAQFEARAIPIPGCRRFVCLNSANQNAP